MQWNRLTDISQLSELINISKEQSPNQTTVLIFKHSTRCSISSMALNRVESKWIDRPDVKPYYLDLISHRDISNEIATLFGVEHASPQVLLIQNGACVYHNSHNGISVPAILEAI